MNAEDYILRSFHHQGIRNRLLVLTSRFFLHLLPLVLRKLKENQITRQVPYGFPLFVDGIYWSRRIAHILIEATTATFTRWKLPIHLKAPSMGKCNNILQRMVVEYEVHVMPNHRLTWKSGTHIRQIYMNNENTVWWDGYQFHPYDIGHPVLPM